MLVNASVVVSVVASLAVAPRTIRRRTGEAPGIRAVRAASIGPGIALIAVALLIYLNQVLFTVYVVRVHGGDASFIARYLPDGWFALADRNPLIRWLAEHFPAPELLAPSVLRVQAFLELPFVLLAFATVLRWLDRGLYRRVARSPLIWLAAASYTAVFCAAEWDLRNPYTIEDIAIRLVAAVVTPPLIMALADREREDSPPVSVSGLLLFGASLWGLGHLVLVVYDTALLYNLGKLRAELPGAAVALAVLVAVRAAASRFPGHAAVGAAVTTVGSGLRWSLALFFVPALAVRYGVNFGSPLLAAAAGGCVLLVAAVRAVREGLGDRRLLRNPERLSTGVGQLGFAAAAGFVAAYAAVHWATDTYYEAALLRAMCVFLITAIAVCAVTDEILHRMMRKSSLSNGEA
ncbi:hypothetical protein ABT173_37375 [Streptomyces sp. NPDC001795]|uniref:hypothetical protein n=1 Tax=unclassified Streptomyces TaxID=2593676 RepID=UPI003333F31D